MGWANSHREDANRVSLCVCNSRTIAKILDSGESTNELRFSVGGVKVAKKAVKSILELGVSLNG